MVGEPSRALGADAGKALELGREPFEGPRGAGHSAHRRRKKKDERRTGMRPDTRPAFALRHSPFYRRPGIMPDSIAEVFFSTASSTRREASRNAARTRSWSVSTSFGSTAEGAM